MRAMMFAAAMAVASPVLGEAIDEKAAKRALFSLKGHSVIVSQDLSEQDQKIVTGIIPLMAKQLRQPVRYYAAIAYSPDDGLVHEALQAALNYHTVDAAGRAAIKACNALKSKGTSPCKLAASVVPKKYKDRAFTLSVDATAAFSKAYRKEKSPKFFAISRATGGWGIGKTAESAVKSCESSAKPGDCAIVIQD